MRTLDFFCLGEGRGTQVLRFCVLFIVLILVVCCFFFFFFLVFRIPHTSCVLFLVLHAVIGGV